jgi:hypothetical protein
MAINVTTPDGSQPQRDRHEVEPSVNQQAIMNDLSSDTRFEAGELIAPAHSEKPLCDHCGRPFSRRDGSGGKPQRFCTSECRANFHAQRDQRDQRRRPHVGVTAGDNVGAFEPETRTLIVPQPERDQTAAFDWNKDESVLLPDQRRTAVYRDSAGSLVIRQEAAWNEEDDHVITIAADNVQAFIDRLCDLQGILSFP